MAVTLGLGRVYNVIGTGTGAWVSLKQASAVDFLCILAAGDTYTLQQATDASGTSAANLAIITQYYATTAVGLGTWTKVTQAAGASITATATTQAVTVFAVNENSLSDGFKYVKVTASGAGLVIPIVHDLDVQRTPANLPALAV